MPDGAAYQYTTLVHDGPRIGFTTEELMLKMLALARLDYQVPDRV